jgi:hypothetical protein
LSISPGELPLISRARSKVGKGSPGEYFALPRALAHDGNGATLTLPLRRAAKDFPRRTCEPRQLRSISVPLKQGPWPSSCSISTGDVTKMPRAIPPSRRWP